jgi:hypothetical protein
MILIDREDVDRMDLRPSVFLVEWDPDDPVKFAEGQALDFPEIPAPGPFLCVVTDEDAWAGQREGRLLNVAIKRSGIVHRRKWEYLADLYAEAMGISRQSFVLRFSSMRGQMQRHRGEWLPWDEVHHWPEGGDLAWSALVHGHDPSIMIFERSGIRQVKHL